MSKKGTTKMKRHPLDNVNKKTLTDYLFSTGYKPANSLKELNERVEGKFPTLSLTNTWLKQNNFSQQLWTLFEKSPEYFIFIDYTSKLEEQYHGYYQKTGNLFDKFTHAVAAMREAVLNIYQNYLPNYRTDYKIENFRNAYNGLSKEQRNAKFDSKEDLKSIPLMQTREPKPKVVKTKKFYKFSKELIELLANDQTEITKFAPKDNIIVKYLLRKNLTTLAEFMNWASDDKNKNNLQCAACGRQNGRDSYAIFSQNIFDYANKIANNEELGLDKVPDEKFFETLRNLDFEYFKKDSETMRQINQRMKQYVSNKVKPLIEDGFSKDDLKESMDDEYTPYKKMVDAKRRQIELEAEKREVAAYVAKRLQDEENYKVKPGMFNKELGVHKDKHAGNIHQREL